MIKNLIRKVVQKSIPDLISRQITRPYRLSLIDCKTTFSQEGEDMILSRYFQGKMKGFYVDIGAHHPVRFSNTYKFYLMGWRGINIDAMPGSMSAFNEIRPEDINLELSVSLTEEELTYYIFNDYALNTFSKEVAESKNGKDGFTITRQIKLHTYPLYEILDKYLPKKMTIDFFSIDVEGLDIEVLKSNNWDLYRPELILVEDLKTDLENIFASEIYDLLRKHDYKLVYKTFNTLFFKRI